MPVDCLLPSVVSASVHDPASSRSLTSCASASSIPRGRLAPFSQVFVRPPRSLHILLLLIRPAAQLVLFAVRPYLVVTTMGFLKHLRSKSRNKSQQELHFYPKKGKDYSVALPAHILERIFAFVCPHTTDETYEVSERSITLSACVLCDLRDLASCSLVSRRWQSLAQPLL